MIRFPLLALIFCFYLLSRIDVLAQDYQGVVVVKTRVDQADEFASAVPFFRYETHQVTSSFHLGNVHPYIVKNQLIAAILDFKTGPYIDNLLHSSQLAQIEQELSKLRAVDQRHPQTRLYLKKPYQILTDARERLLAGQVRVQSRWLLKSEHEANLRQKIEAAEASRLKLENEANERALRDYNHRLRLSHLAGNYLLEQYRATGHSWLSQVHTLPLPDALDTHRAKEYPLPWQDIYEPILSVASGEDSIAMLRYLDADRRTRAIHLAVPLKWSEGKLINQPTLQQVHRWLSASDVELAAWLPMGLTGCYTQQELNREQGKPPTATRTQRRMTHRRYELSLTPTELHSDGSLFALWVIKIL